MLIGFIIISAIIIVALLAFIIQRSIRAHQQQASAGREELVGKAATVDISLEPKGVVLVEGERWTAILDEGRVEAGEEVIITKVNGLKLQVTKNNKGG